MNKSWTRKCPKCSEDYKVFHCYWKRGQMRYCSHKCAMQSARSKDSIVFRGTLYHISNGYYTSSLTGKKLHREKWKELRGKIPNGFVVHHKDGVKTNNKISNLEVMEWGEHSRNHNYERIRAKRT